MAFLVLRNINSALTVTGQVFGRQLLETTAAAASQVLTLSANALVSGYAWSQPNNQIVVDQPGTWTVRLDIPSGAAQIEIAARLARVSSTGVLQTQSVLTAEVTGNSGGLEYTFPNLNLGEFAPTDRLRIQYQFRNTDTMMSRDITVGYNTLLSGVDIPETVPDPEPNGTIVAGFPTTSDPLWGPQIFKVPVRLVGSGSPTARVDLLIDGVYSGITAATTVTSTTAQDATLVWDGTDVTGTVTCRVRTENVPNGYVEVRFTPNSAADIVWTRQTLASEGEEPVSATPGTAVINVSANTPTALLGAINVTPSTANIVASANTPTTDAGANVATPGTGNIAISANTPIASTGVVSATPDTAGIVLSANTPEPAQIQRVTHQFTNRDPAQTAYVRARAEGGEWTEYLEIAPDPTDEATPGTAPILHSANAPQVALGPVELVPGSAPVEVSAYAASASVGVLSAEPGTAVVSVGSNAPEAAVGDVSTSTGTAVLVVEGQYPTISLGAVEAAAGTAALSVSANAPNAVVLGEGEATPLTAQIRLHANAPEVEVVAIDATPGTAYISVGANAPTADSSTQATPGTAYVINNANAPTVELGSVSSTATTAVISTSAYTPTASITGFEVTPNTAYISIQTQAPQAVIAETSTEPGTAYIRMRAFAPQAPIVEGVEVDFAVIESVNLPDTRADTVLIPLSWAVTLTAARADTTLAWSGASAQIISTEFDAVAVDASFVYEFLRRG